MHEKIVINIVNHFCLILKIKTQILHTAPLTENGISKSSVLEAALLLILPSLLLVYCACCQLCSTYYSCMIKLGWENRHTCFMVKCTFTVPLYVSTCKPLVLLGGGGSPAAWRATATHSTVIWWVEKVGVAKDIRKTQFRPGKMWLSGVGLH